MKPFIKKCGLVLTGGALQGFGMGVFLFPQDIPSGGAGGIAILLNHWFEMGMGPSLWIVNFTMLTLGVQYLGKRFALWTFVGITMTSLAVDFFESTFPIVHRHLLLDLVIGSVFLGTGIGILMRQGVSNGGVGVIAFMISHGRNILPGKPLFLINTTIFIVTAAVISWEIVILALVSQWISTSKVDLVYRLKLYHVYTLSWHKKT
ncbi:YitT family protein [Lentibacillus salinarum]|uniref:YitT family protein n=1 Tax=Lentibacillus salinarum TaxID=446820 RepID=A0ABW3ZYP8_9BACI